MGEWRRSSNTFLTSLLGREEWLAAYPAALFQGKALLPFGYEAGYTADLDAMV